MLQIRVIFPLLEMYGLFHMANLLRNLLYTPFQVAKDLNGAPKNNPK